MDPVRLDGLKLIWNGLHFYGDVQAAEIMTKLTESLSEKEAWDVIAEAERIGMIEHAEMVFEAQTPKEQEWRLVEGFDPKRLDMLA